VSSNDPAVSVVRELPAVRNATRRADIGLTAAFLAGHALLVLGSTFVLGILGERIAGCADAYCRGNGMIGAAYAVAFWLGGMWLLTDVGIGVALLAKHRRAAAVARFGFFGQLVLLLIAAGLIMLGVDIS
jgi:hypothetical protein